MNDSTLDTTKSLYTSLDEANRNNRKAKYQEIVRKNQHWEYPLSVPSIDELLSLGYDQQQSEIIREDIADLKDVTTRMRKGQYIPVVDPNPNDSGEFSSNYDGYFLHYKEFKDALVEYRHTIDYMDMGGRKFRFSFGATQIPRKFLDLLQDALQQTHFHGLDFYPNNVDGVGYIDFIANCVTADSRLKILGLEGFVFDHSNEIDVLCAAVNEKDLLQEVKMTECEIEDGDLCEVFTKLKSKSIEKIDLADNNLSNLGPTDISDFLVSNSSLVELRLCGNPFNEQDIVHTANALRHNTTLRQLMFRFHEPPSNLDLLKSVVFDRSGLDSAYYSNHHCKITILREEVIGHDIIESDITADVRNFNKCYDHVMNRRKKIYNILSTRNMNRENAAYFESRGMSINHIPQILSVLKPFSEHHLYEESGRQEEDEVTPLSIAYEIMRDWKIPEVYNLTIIGKDCLESDDAELI
eukprot:scaffold2686_cov70-Cyclotella_meneghiniana.AAC.3